MLTGTQTFISLMKAGLLNKNQHENLEKFLLEQDAEITRLRAALNAMTAKRDSALEANALLIQALSLIREKDLRVGGRTSDGVYHVDGELGRIAAAAIHAILKQEDKG